MNKKLSNYKTNSEKKKAYLENLLLEANNKLDNIERHNNLKIPTLMSANLFTFLFVIIAAPMISEHLYISDRVIRFWVIAIIVLSLSSIACQALINFVYLNRKRFIQAIESLLNELNKK